MFTQFRVRYPKGCLISEFVATDHGKYIVRSLVILEGVTLATGLAAADTVELAEDQARTRALAVLDISTSTGETVIPSTTPETSTLATSQPQATFAQDTWKPFQQNTLFPDTTEATTPPPSFSEPNIAAYSPLVSSEENATPFVHEFHSPGVTKTTAEDSPEIETPPFLEPLPDIEPIASSFSPSSEEMGNFPIGASPLMSEPDYLPTSIEASNDTTAIPPISEPADLSDVIARTNVELRRLGWTTEQGRDYLKRTYGKSSRQQLSDEQLLEFLHYLEFQPTPYD